MIKKNSRFCRGGCWAFCTDIRAIFVQNTEDGIFSYFFIEIIIFMCYNNL